MLVTLDIAKKNGNSLDFEVPIDFRAKVILEEEKVVNYIRSGLMNSKFPDKYMLTLYEVGVFELYPKMFDFCSESLVITKPHNYSIFFHNVAVLAAASILLDKREWLPMFFHDIAKPLALSKGIPMNPFHTLPENIDKAYSRYKMPHFFLNEKELKVATFFSKNHTKNVYSLNCLKTSMNMRVVDLLARVYFLDSNFEKKEKIVNNTAKDFLQLLDVVRETTIRFKNKDNRIVVPFQFESDNDKIKYVISGFRVFLN